MTDVGQNAQKVQGPLAMWEADIQHIELEKGSRGLGFSILDYQVKYTLLLTKILMKIICTNDILLVVEKKEIIFQSSKTFSCF